MNQNDRIVVLIPARNEESTVAEVVKAAFAQIQCDVIVIDDASSDRTADAAKTAGATVLPLALQLGAWGAIQTGFRYALQKGYKIAVTLDADGQHPASSIRSLVEPIKLGEADVVIGSCVKRGSPARHVAWSFFRWISGIGLKDLTSGFRAYNEPSLQLLSTKDASLLDYQDIGVLILLLKAGLRVVEKQVEMCPRATGSSRVFSSWWVVGKYMLASGILCLAKR